MNADCNCDTNKASEFFRKNFERNLKLWREKEKIYGIISKKLKKTIQSMSEIGSTSSQNDISIQNTTYQCSENRFAYPEKIILEETLSGDESDYVYYKEASREDCIEENAFYTEDMYFEKCESDLSNSYTQSSSLERTYEEIEYDYVNKPGLQTNCISTDPVYKNYVTRISEAISLQHLIIYQISKALVLCRNKKGLLDSKTLVEAERILLLAHTRKSILNLNISKESEDNLHPQSTININIRSITFYLNPYKLRYNNNKLPQIYYLCLVICNEEVLATEVTTSEKEKVVFNSPLVLSYVPIEYNINLQVYAMSVKIPRKCKFTIIKKVKETCSLLYKNIATCFRKKLVTTSPEEHCRPMFVLWGNSTLPIPNISKMKEFRIKNLEPSLLQTKFCAAIDLTH